jgi:hypothetical protein
VRGHLLAVGVLIVVAGCSDDDPEPVGLLGPGTSITDGYVVPPGTQLVGSVFPQVGEGALRPDSVPLMAVLDIDGDPFAAWDDLAAQASEQGLDFPSSGVCWWDYSTSADRAERSVPVPVVESRPPDADTIRCNASATGESHALIAELRWSPEGAALVLDFQPAVGAPGRYPDDEPGPAPPEAAESLPAIDDRPLPVEGEPFGREMNCGEDDYQRLRVPSGARLVAPPPQSAGEVEGVLAVDDAKQALEDLRAQLDIPDDRSGSYDIEERELPDGSPAWQLSGGSDGGGVCRMWTSPDGNALIITAHSD